MRKRDKVSQNLPCCPEVITRNLCISGPKGPWPARAWLTGEEGSEQLKMAQALCLESLRTLVSGIWECTAGTSLCLHQSPVCTTWCETHVRPPRPYFLLSLLLPGSAPGLGHAQEKEWPSTGLCWNQGGGGHEWCPLTLSLVGDKTLPSEGLQQSTTSPL